VDAALDRARGDAEQGSDLGDGAVFDVHEAQHLSFRPREGRCDVGADHGGFGGVQAGSRVSSSGTVTGPRLRSRRAAWLRAITHIQACGVPSGR